MKRLKRMVCASYFSKSRNAYSRTYWKHPLPSDLPKLGDHQGVSDVVFVSVVNWCCDARESNFF